MIYVDKNRSVWRRASIATTVATPQQVTYPYPYPIYPATYAPMFLEILFLMIFLVLPFMMIIPLFKALAKGFEG
jgi:hypothetical protein